MKLETTAEKIKSITHHHLTQGNGLLFGQFLPAVGWISGTEPDSEGIVDTVLSFSVNNKNFFYR